MRELESIPVLIKAGGVLPLSADKGNLVENPKQMQILAYEGDGEYVLYEDGLNKARQGEAFTRFTMQNLPTATGLKQVLTIQANGELSVLPTKRLYKVRFKNIPLQAKISLFENGKRKRIKEIYTDCPAVDFYVTGNAVYRVEVEYKPLSKMEKLLQHAREVLTRANMENALKKKFYADLKVASSVEEYKKLVKTSQLSKGLKARLMETL